ncbi:MAG TPA: NAD(P)/FAD-dependent oxidoreductase [Actinomycetota bacterium]|nr:NAD(P)/FAD-dependent oxidoreductase [Actinomycetota bacterium]
MAERYDVAVVGAGHNGLVCAAYLARAGLRVVVLERRDRAGGPLETAEIAPGFRAPAGVHTVGRLRRSVVRDLALERHALRLLQPAVRSFAPHPDGRAVTLWDDPARTAAELEPWSARDAAAYQAFDRRVRALASLMGHLHATVPPNLSSPSLDDALAGLRVAAAVRRAWGPREVREALRILPMPVADFVDEAFATDALRAAIAARGVHYTAMGPRAAGTTAVLLSDSVGQRGAGERPVTVAGGPGALADALVAAARSSGAEVRCGAEAVAVTTSRRRVTGVALAGGEEVLARAVVSGADPKRTLLDLVDPALLGPTLSWRASNIRSPGTLAKVNLALDALPTFPAASDEERLRGRIVVAPGIDDLERAFDASKYGGISEEPYLEATIPTLSDPSLAPEGGHVMSVLLQWAPYRLRDGDWKARREELGDLAIKRLEQVAPGMSGMVLAREVLTPADVERRYGLTEGHPLHAEPGLDQFFAWRPLLGYARYRMPVAGLYLCGSGAHPGGGITGAPGANAARVVLGDLRR